jgi:hypothetical protein
MSLSQNLNPLINNSILAQPRIPQHRNSVINRVVQPKLTVVPNNSFINKLNNEIDVNNLDLRTKKLIASKIIGDRHGSLIQGIIQRK